MYSLHALSWDLEIFAILAGSIAMGYFLYRRKQYLFIVLPVAIFTVVFYGSFIEPQRITITEHKVELPIAENLTIAVLSDIHVGPYKGRKYLMRVAERIREINPDILLLPGDFVYRGMDPMDALMPLKDIQPRYGAFAVLGNHEYDCVKGNIFLRTGAIGFDPAKRVMRALERLNIHVLVNESMEVRTPSGPIYISGVDDSCTGRNDTSLALPELTKKAPIILLSHDPSIILDNPARYAHLIVSGHTHAGQIRFPWIGSITKLPTQLGQTYDQGLFYVDKNTTLAITRGIGESGPRARLLAPPEIMVLRAGRSVSVDSVEQE